MAYTQIKQNILGVEMRLTWGLNPLASEFEPQTVNALRDSTTFPTKLDPPPPAQLETRYADAPVVTTMIPRVYAGAPPAPLPQNGNFRYQQLHHPAVAWRGGVPPPNPYYYTPTPLPLPIHTVTPFSVLCIAMT